MQIPVVFGMLAAATGFILAPSRSDDGPRKNLEPGVNLLSQEVSALRTLYRLRVTPAQMQVLLKLAPETMAKLRDVKKAKVSDDYRSLLSDLRQALMDAEDDDRIGDLEEKVQDLHESENPEVNDTYAVTGAARQHVPELFKRLKPSQVAAYISSLPSEEVLDPVDELVSALEGVRELKPDVWKESCNELGEELAWLVAGLNSDKGEKVYQDVVALLKKSRELSESQFSEQRPALAKKARKLVGDLDPNEVLRHHLERSLADLLANPRLETALKARLEPEK